MDLSAGRPRNSKNMRLPVLFALLWQVFNLVLSEASTTSITMDIQEACSNEINSCTRGSSDCLICLTQIADLDASTLEAPEGSDCTSAYISLCSVMLDDYGCNGEDPYINEVAGCVASELFEGCDDFVSCAISASTNVSTFSPTSQPTVLTASPSVGLSSAPTMSPTLLETSPTQSPTVSITASPSESANTQDDASGSTGGAQCDLWVPIVSTLGLMYVALITFLS